MILFSGLDNLTERFEVHTVSCVLKELTLTFDISFKNVKVLNLITLGCTLYKIIDNLKL